MTTENSINQKNFDNIKCFFLDGIKTKDNQKLGVEVEHFICTKNGQSVSFDGEQGVESLLQKLATHYIDKSYSNGRLVGLARPYCTISIEPAAQIEASLGEFENVGCLIAEYQKFLDECKAILDEWGQELITQGYHPHSQADDLTLIPKQRYYIMDSHFRNCGGTGVNMMRASAATQVSIDYTSEQDYKNKFRLANVLTPLLAFIFDNTKVYQNNPAKPLTRFTIWNNLEGTTSSNRTGFVADCFLDSVGFDAYAQYLLDSKPLFYYNDNDEVVFTDDKTVAEIFANKELRHKDIVHIMSMVFPFVRLKNYIEIRMADSMPIEWVKEYLQVIKGIFYNEQNLTKLLNLTKTVTLSQANEAWSVLTKDRCQALVYGKTAKEWGELILSMKAEN